MARQIPSNRLLKTSFSSRTPPEKNRDDMIFFQSIIRRLNKQELIHFGSIGESMTVRRGHFKGCWWNYILLLCQKEYFWWFANSRWILLPRVNSFQFLKCTDLEKQSDNKNSWVEQREVRFSKDHSIKSDDSEGVMLLTSTVCYLNSRGTTIKNTVAFEHRKTCCTDKHTWTTEKCTGSLHCLLKILTDLL